MACATLKRSLDWEALNQRPTKRRRCNPLGQSGSGASPARSVAASSSASAYDSPSNGRYVIEPHPNPFTEANISKISPDKMAQDIRDEIKRLHRYKRLQFTTAGTIDGMQQDSESSGSEMGADSPRRPDSPPSIVRNPEKALFTFKQVQLICARMLKEREDEIREKYDKVLTNKLAEQYDAFVKFTYDQIQKRYEAAPSYLS